MSDAQLLHRNVQITYFDPFALFDSVKDEFLKLFPLHNVRWKSKDGPMKIINELPVALRVEDSLDHKSGPALLGSDGDPFIKFIVVTCQTIDEYRAKVRPLLRQWLPSQSDAIVSQSNPLESDDNSPKDDKIILPIIPIILMYANSSVVESNLFTSMSIIEKVNRDFPGIDVLELKSVYKSPKEKQEFWNQLKSNIKLHLLTILQKRLLILQQSLSFVSATVSVSPTLPTQRLASSNKNKNLLERITIREQLFNLYLEFNLQDEANMQMNEIQREINNLNIIQNTGKLEYPFSFKLATSLHSLLEQNSLSKYYYHKFNFIAKLNIIALDKNFANRTSVIQIHKITNKFIREMELLFFDDPNLLEFKYFLIESICDFLPEEQSSKAVIELKAELLLMKRDCWLNGVLATTDFKLLHIHFNEDKNCSYKFDKLKETFCDEDTFHEHYVDKNKEILSLFHQCDSKRLRIIDILSIEIGVVHYQRKDYEKAVSLFMSCYEYYIQSNWNFIGFEILKIFVDSLVNCPSITTLDLDDSTVPVSTILCNAYLNLLKLSKNEEEKSKWWKRFLEIERQENTTLIYSTEGLLDITIDKYVTLNMGNKRNEYKILFNLDEFNLPEDIMADSIKLILTNDQGEIVKFRESSLMLLKGRKEYCLTTTNINFSKFYITSFEINVGNATFLQEFPMTSDREIYIEPICNGDNISVDIIQSSSLLLGENALDIKYQNFENLKTFSLNLKVEKSDNDSQYPISFNEKESIIEYTITNESHINEKVEYYILQPITSFFLRSELTFTIENESDKKVEEYKEIKHHYIQCYLPISVSVEDIFKRDKFYFKFLLNSSMREEPIFFYRSKLCNDSEDKYRIDGNFEPLNPILLTASLNETDNTSCLNCYKLVTQGDYKFSSNDIFNLHVYYNTLKEQLDCLVTDSILVQGNMEWYDKFKMWETFWNNDILTRLQYDYDRFDKERIIILEDRTFNMERMINDVLQRVALGLEVKQNIIRCLRCLVEGCQINEIDLEEYSKNMTNKELIVPVELPDFERFYYVTFEQSTICGDNPDLTVSPMDIELPEVGNTLPFSISITDMNDQWDTTTTTQSETEAETEQATDNIHIFEIASSNEWLVHGKKRFILPEDLSTAKNKNYTFTATLIPLKKGYLSLPRIEIVNQDGLPSRIDQPNAHDTILVL